jgi:hypothetical protein
VSRSFRLHIEKVSVGQKAPESELVVRVLHAAERLRDALRSALDEACPPPRRPTDLVRRLGLDKTLASRLHRAANGDEPIEGVLDGAGVPGLRLVLGRLRDRAAGPAVVALGETVEEFARACDAFPDGRLGLEVAMADYMPELRAQSERKARRSVFQAHSALMGFHQETAYRAVVRVPTPGDDDAVDVIFVESALGLRLLRPGVSVVIAGAAAAVGPDGLDAMTLDRRRATDLDKLLIRERCSLRPEEYQRTVRNGSATFMLPPHSPALGPPVDLAVGQVFSGAMRRRGTAERPYDVSFAVFRKPVRVLVWDELFDPSLPGSTVVTASFASGPGPLPTRPEDDTVYRVRQPEQFEDLGVGLSRIASRDVPDCAGLLETALRRAGVEPSRLAVRRLRIEYPPAHARLIAWIPLPVQEGGETGGSLVHSPRSSP